MIIEKTPSNVNVSLDVDAIHVKIQKVSRYGSFFGKIMKVLNFATEITYTEEGQTKSVYVNTNSLFKKAVNSWIASGDVKALNRAWGESKKISKDDKEIIDRWVSKAKNETSKTHKNELTKLSLSTIIAQWQFNLGTMPLRDLFPPVPLNGIRFRPT